MEYQFYSDYGPALLDASAGYIKADDAERDLIANGCGPAGWRVDVVPDSIFFLSIKEACRIHDWDYQHGKTWADKKAADKRFLDNIHALINAKRNQWRWVKRKRRKLARVYYLAVKYGGGNAFKKGKPHLMAA